MSVLPELLAGNPHIWRGHRDDGHVELQPGIETGFAELDRALPAQGWPTGSVIELVADQDGVGELKLLLPAMAALSNQKRWIAWIAPPYIPYAPSLLSAGVSLPHCMTVNPVRAQDAVWAMEKMLRNAGCGMALMWLDKHLDNRAARRLQLAAEAGGSLGMLFYRRAPAVSPASLRLKLSRDSDCLQVQVLKSRGMHERPVVALEL